MFIHVKYCYMKKNMLLIAFIALWSGMISCKSSSSSSFEKDVRKRAEFMCEIQKLTAKAAADSNATGELDKVKKELDDYDARMEQKYKDKKPTDKESENARKIIDDIMAKCK